jgi:hypothetical protein
VANRRDVPLELIEKAVAEYHFNPHFLFSGLGSLISGPSLDDGLRIRNLTVMTDQNSDERIIHVPYPAQAGYGKLLDDRVFMQELPSYQLPDPQFRSGTYRSFEISGSSMEPTFKTNDIVIAAYIEGLGQCLAKPSVKQHLAAIRMPFDYLVIGQIIPMNPAASVRGPKHVVEQRGDTEAVNLLKSAGLKVWSSSVESGLYQSVGLVVLRNLRNAACVI